MSKVARIPLIGGPSDVPVNQDFNNIIFTRSANPLTESQIIKPRKRPGISTGTSITTATDVYAVSPYPFATGGGNVFSVVKTGTNTIRTCEEVTVAGADTTVTGNNGCSRIKAFTDSSGVLNWAFSVSAAATANKKSFIYVDGSGLTELTDADFPDATTTGQPAFLDGYLFWITYDLGRIYNSDLNAPTAYTSTSFLTVTSGDAGTGLANYRDKIVAIGTNYIEFYENVGNATGSPLQQIDHLRIKGYGVPSTDGNEDNSHGYIEGMGTIFWINYFANDTGPGVYMLDGFQPKKISTAFIDAELESWPASTIVGVFSAGGYRYLVIQLTLAGVSDAIRVYCLELNCWTTWSTSSLFNEGLLHIVHGDDAQEDFLYSGTSRYSFTQPFIFTDSGSAFTSTITTRNLDLGTGKRKRFNRLRLCGSDPGATSNCVVSWSFDNQQNYSTTRTLNLADSDGFPFTTRLGIGRQISVMITNASNAQGELEALELEYDELAA